MSVNKQCIPIIYRYCALTDCDNEDLEFPAKYIILDDFDFALVGLGIKKKKHF